MHCIDALPANNHYNANGSRNIDVKAGFIHLAFFTFIFTQV